MSKTTNEWRKAMAKECLAMLANFQELKLGYIAESTGNDKKRDIKGYKRIHYILEKLIEQGLVEKSGMGIYRIAEKGRKSLDAGKQDWMPMLPPISTKEKRGFELTLSDCIDVISAINELRYRSKSYLPIEEWTRGWVQFAKTVGRVDIERYRDELIGDVKRYLTVVIEILDSEISNRHSQPGV